MATGNNKTEGSKGNNFSWQFKNLLGLQKIADNTNGVLSTLTSILNATRAHQDMEILLVRDTGNANLIVQQIREYDETTSTWLTTYTDIVGAPYIPVGPIEYMDASAVLNLILAELLDQGLTLDNIDAFFSATGQTTMANSLPVVIASNQSALPVTLPTGANTLGYIRTVGVTPVVIPAGAKKINIFNVGPDDITVDVGAGAKILDMGLTIPFVAQEGKTLPAITLTGSTALSKHFYTSVV